MRAAEAFDPGEEPSVDPAPGAQAGRIARSTAFFSVATAASRIAGLVREVFAASYYGVSGPMSAFTIAFQVPNLVRSLFADAALQPAFIPIFTEQLEQKNYREAFRLASTLLLLVTLVLGAITALFVLLAPVDHAPLRARLRRRDPRPHRQPLAGPLPDPDPARDQRHRRRHPQQLRPLRRLRDRAVLLERDDHRRPRRRRADVPRADDRIYAYAIGILVGTLVQLLIPAFDLRNTPFEFSFSFAWRNPGVRRVLLLMLPVTLSLGLINFNLLINSLFGSLVSDEAPAAIDKAFRIYQLPQGIFSVAIATVLFPTLARFASRGEHDNLRATMANGMRQILFILIPAAAAILVLSEPMIRLVYQRGEFTPDQTTLVATALFWFAFSLPTNGLFLLLTRTFFSLQRPWVPTAIAAGNLAVTALASLAPLPPRGRRDRRRDGDRDHGQRRRPVRDPAPDPRRPRARPPARQRDPDLDRRGGLAAVSFGVWDVLDGALGRGLGGQIVSLGAALALGGLAYLGAAKLLRIAELDQIVRLLRRR